jgi:hypothetical protein
MSHLKTQDLNSINQKLRERQKSLLEEVRDQFDQRRG